MIKSFIVDSTCNEMRLDRYLRNKLGKIPQALLEKNLRFGKIKVNRRKSKSSLKVKTNDKIDIFDFNFKENIDQKKILFTPSNEIIKSNEDLIIDNNDDFIVLNKSAGISLISMLSAILFFTFLVTNSDFIIEIIKPPRCELLF